MFVWYGTWCQDKKKHFLTPGKQDPQSAENESPSWGCQRPENSGKTYHGLSKKMKDLILKYDVLIYMKDCEALENLN